MELSSIKPIAQVQSRRCRIDDYDNFGSTKIGVLGCQFSGAGSRPFWSPGSGLRLYNYAIHIT